MDWKWGLVQLAVAFAIWVWFMRTRSSMQAYSDDLRRAARDLHDQSTELKATRQAAKESKLQASLRATELQTLRNRVADLEAINKSQASQLDLARTRVNSLQAKNSTMDTRISRLDVQRACLEKDLAAANLVRLELLSQARTDESQRITALNSLRQPTNSLRTPSTVLSRQGSGRLRGADELAISPLPVSKSPSESLLLSLHPNLSVSDDEDDDIDYRAFEETSRALEERMGRASAGRWKDGEAKADEWQSTSTLGGDPQKEPGESTGLTRRKGRETTAKVSVPKKTEYTALPADIHATGTRGSDLSLAGSEDSAPPGLRNSLTDVTLVPSKPPPAQDKDERNSSTSGSGKEVQSFRKHADKPDVIGEQAGDVNDAYAWQDKREGSAERPQNQVRDSEGLSEDAELFEGSDSAGESQADKDIKLSSFQTALDFEDVDSPMSDIAAHAYALDLAVGARRPDDTQEADAHGGKSAESAEINNIVSPAELDPQDEYSAAGDIRPLETGGETGNVVSAVPNTSYESSPRPMSNGEPNDPTRVSESTPVPRETPRAKDGVSRAIAGSIRAHKQESIEHRDNADAEAVATDVPTVREELPESRYTCSSDVKEPGSVQPDAVTSSASNFEVSSTPKPKSTNGFPRTRSPWMDARHPVLRIDSKSRSIASALPVACWEGRRGIITTSGRSLLRQGKAGAKGGEGDEEKAVTSISHDSTSGNFS